MFLDALNLFVVAYALIMIPIITYDGWQYYLGLRKKKARQVILATFYHGGRRLCVHLIAVIPLYLAFVCTSEPYRQTGRMTVGQYDALEALEIYERYNGEIPSEYGDAFFLFQVLDRAMVQSMDAIGVGPEWYSENEATIADEWRLAGGLREMYIGLIEADTSSYRRGGIWLKQWLESRKDSQELVRSGI